MLVFRDDFRSVRELYPHKGKTWDNCFIEAPLSIHGVYRLSKLDEAHPVSPLKDQDFLNVAEDRKCFTDSMFGDLLF